ncbi:VOC family protein [Pseudomonas putida]
MFSHITLGTNDVPRALSFYEQILKPLGITLIAHRFNPERVLFGKGTAPSDTVFCVYSPLNGEPATVGNGTTVAFQATTRAQVDQFYAAAMALGAGDEGAPGIRAHYSPDYYGTYIRDLDGNKLCCVCHRTE